MYGDGFADVVAVADLQARQLPLVFLVLRIPTENRVRMNDIVAADRGMAGDDNVAKELVARTHDDIRPDCTEWPDLATLADHGPGVDHGQWRNSGTGLSAGSERKDGGQCVGG